MIIEGIKIENKKSGFSITCQSYSAGTLIKKPAEGYRFEYSGAVWFLHYYRTTPVVNFHLQIPHASKGVWMVTESRTGMRGAQGTTRALAIRDLKERLDRFKAGPKKMDSVIKLASAINKGALASVGNLQH